MAKHFQDLAAAKSYHEINGGYLLDLGEQPTEAATRPQQGASRFTRYNDTGPFGTVCHRTWAVMDEGCARDHRSADQLAALAPTYSEA
jgi:hypothetical protein